jgi:hypothetical protein
VATLAVLVGVGVALHFSTPGLQSYHHDEIITVTRVLPGSFVHMLRRVKESESNLAGREVLGARAGLPIRSQAPSR